jgi:YD repeat-containing protein
MRKFICLAVCPVALCSCTSSGNDTAVAQLLKHAIITSPSGTVTTTTVTYSGNKLVSSVTDTGYGQNYTYSGNRMAQVDYQANGETYATERYTYNSSGRVATFVDISWNENLGIKQVFHYDADGNATIEILAGDTVSQTSPSGSGAVVFQNGEVYQITDTFSTKTYYYDNKINPNHDVAGLDAISFVNDKALGIAHNVTKIISTNAPGIVRDYTYNDNGYPLTMVQSDGNQTTTVEYIYE